MIPPARSSPEGPLAGWAEFLSAHKLRATVTRQVIIQAITQSTGHFDAETLRLRLKAQGRRLSRATIYRTLALLQRGGLLRRVQLKDGTLHYELPRIDDPQHRLVCRRCGGVQEVLDPTLAKALMELSRVADFTPEEHSLRIRGVCARCRGGRTPESAQRKA